MTEALEAEQVEQLELRIGYHFRDPLLLTHALTHASAADTDSGRDNERLEFLGDRILALLAAQALMDHYPEAEEGGLAVRLNALVRKETCAKVAGQLGLGAYLILGETENQFGGREKPAILGDCCEAVIAAIYLDGGLEAARNFFESNWTSLVEGLHLVPKDAKTVLQEWSQGRGLPAPTYRLVSRTGPDHQPVFEIEVNVKGKAPDRAVGTSKRIAEQTAAASLLIRLGIWKEGQAS